MRYRHLASALFAAGMVAFVSPPPASAVPAGNIGSAVEKPSGVEVVRHGRRGFRGYRGGGRFYGHRGRHFRGYRSVRPYRSYRYAYRRPWRYYGGPYIAFGIGTGSCHWLKRNAYRTGSSYWWRRYRACLY